MDLNRRKLIAVSLFVLSFNFINAQTEFGNVVTAEQKIFISALSGNSEAFPNVILKDRYTEENRTNAVKYIENSLTRAGFKVKKQFYSEAVYNNKIMEGCNVYTMIPATRKTDEYIIIGAHFDSGEKDCPGAIDNATGCALIYSVAKLVKGVKNRQKNVLVVFFDQEEVGRIGSKAFAKMLEEKKYNVHSIHCADQLGWDEDSDKFMEIEKPSEELKELYYKHAKALEIPINTTKVISDHESFREQGYKQVVGLTEKFFGEKWQNRDTTPHYHKPTDTFETVNFEYLASGTQLIYNIIANLIN
ncbi:MAG: M20/M25/M40 family metallo-hydrolase [Carboxylicivirga sp.]|jgi:hypothetical protein|nr:M20/M25/M40 family metallo-hydrolase [Carboxylicivirga sp.]